MHKMSHFNEGAVVLGLLVACRSRLSFSRLLRVLDSNSFSMRIVHNVVRVQEVN